ncbi:NAD(P)-dependent oxidoreductase [Actinopolymorpha singaporensis]|uniref:3-hydroxyisobutyrate dehydrogenase n=1 Tax=Actinopolymorpha singaporensis TaxID=117157 RepID=A0A1H1RSE5_9ACTN|nr:NAD(P)-dependent oxidoreductase [Actinopolymorpha singaporensis]SDS37949.1 3-hydroxyisobutyrate dehydrogenase [Actinopolymorpha singaporensis]
MVEETAGIGSTGTVGIVGTGTMGSAVADVLRPHHRLVVWDVDEASVRRQEAAGSVVATDVAELATEADVVLLSLPGPDVVRTVVAGECGVLAAASGPRVIADLSTVDPGTARAMATAAAEAGVGYLDAPVLGRPHRCGAWTLPVGGAEADLALARPVLEKVASRVIRVGDVGAGSILKLLNNLMFGAINAITAETMAAAERLGLDPQTYYSTLADSGAASVSNLFREIAPKIAARDWSPAFTVDLLAKDNRLGLAVLEDAGITPPVARAVVGLNEDARSAGLGALDTSALVQLFEGVGREN